MKAYELKALLATLDDSAEVSIELETDEEDRWTSTPKFGIEAGCGCAPRSATLRVTAEDLKVIPGAQERIEELEQQRDDLREAIRNTLAVLPTLNGPMTERAENAIIELEKML